MMQTRGYRTAVRLMLIACLPLVGGACATAGARVAQFGAFAEAGTQFADAVPAVLDESFNATVTTSSLVLAEARPGLLLLDADIRRSTMLEQLEQNDALLLERIGILRDVKQHAGVLREYFVALQALAQTDANSSGLTDVARGLVTALGSLSPAIANASVGGKAVSGLVPPIVNFAVAGFQSRVLEEELRRNAGTIERELAVQQAFLTAIAEAMTADLQAVYEAEDRDRIHLPYVNPGNLPGDWSQHRLASFQRQVQLSSVDAAAQAAARLRATFVQLVENKVDQGTIAALFVDINSVLTFIETGTGTADPPAAPASGS